MVCKLNDNFFYYKTEWNCFHENIKIEYSEKVRFLIKIIYIYNIISCP